MPDSDSGSDDSTQLYHYDTTPLYTVASAAAFQTAPRHELPEELLRQVLD
jgi:hypothetical protein